MSLLEIQDLRVWLPVEGQARPILTGVDLAIAAGEAVGLVGESGSGKSMTARSVMRLLPRGARVEGRIDFDGRSVLDMGSAQLRRFRGSDVAMIFQDPRAFTNPVRRIGDFITEALVDQRRLGRREANQLAEELLGDVGIDDPPRRMTQYPHELSGGMLQRVMIAAALATEPRLLLADEPTTALDVTTQSEVMAILAELRAERSLATLFITHDLELAAAVCDRIVVMYAGTIAENAPAATLHANARHPYTVGLMASRPDFRKRTARLRAIPGRPISAAEAGAGCPFVGRCTYATDICRTDRPLLRPVGDGEARCHHAESVSPAGVSRSSA